MVYRFIPNVQGNEPDTSKLYFNLFKPGPDIFGGCLTFPLSTDLFICQRGQKGGDFFSFYLEILVAEVS